MSLTDLSAVRQDLAKAHGLPNAHYIDQGVFDEEKNAVLFANWSSVGVAAQVPEPGDALPLTFLGVPLLLLRDTSGVVRVFQNTCRHRGMILVDEPRKIEGAIRCPYHSWCYSTAGKLVSTPHVGGPGQNTHPEIDRTTLGLIEIRSHVWMDVVFVNIDGTAPAFEDANADVIARWAEFDKPIYHCGADSQFNLSVATNCKLAVENYCEIYHLPWVHPGLNSYSRLEDHYNIEAPGHYAGQGTLVYRQMAGDDGAAFDDFADLSDKWDTAAEYIALFPNTLLGVHLDHTFAIVLTPEALDKTVEQIHLYYTTPQTPDAARTKNTALWKEVFKEDVFVVEGMQRGRHGPAFDGGKFSPAMDGPTHVFHDWIAAQVERHRAAPHAAE